jgi:hypothetical protein
MAAVDVDGSGSVAWRGGVARRRREGYLPAAKTAAGA